MHANPAQSLNAAVSSKAECKHTYPKCLAGECKHSCCARFRAPSSASPDSQLQQTQQTLTQTTLSFPSTVQKAISAATAATNLGHQNKVVRKTSDDMDALSTHLYERYQWHSSTVATNLISALLPGRNTKAHKARCEISSVEDTPGCIWPGAYMRVNSLTALVDTLCSGQRKHSCACTLCRFLPSS